MNFYRTLMYTVQELLVIQYHHKQLEAASGIVNAICSLQCFIPLPSAADNPQIPKKWRYFWNTIQKIGDNFGIRT